MAPLLRMTSVVRAVCLVLGLGGCVGGGAEVESSVRGVQQGQELGEVPQVAVAEDLDPSDGVVRVRLVAERDEDGPFGVQYTYNGMSPGPTIRATRGDVVEVELVNALDAPTTIHWHGLHVPFDMDGVTWMGAPVQPGETFTYRFTVDQVGTYWYHPHFDTARQVDAGLYGAFVVESPDEPEVDADLVFVADSLDEHRGGDRHVAAGHGRNVRRWEVNGVEDGVVRVQGGQLVRARFVNVANHGYLYLNWDGDIEHIASDQGLLPSLQTPDHIGLGPGDRADVVWRVGEEGFDVWTEAYSLNGGLTYRDPIRLFRVEVDAPAPAPAMPDWPFSGLEPTPDPGYADIVYAFSGSDRTGTWRINGEAFPDVTIESFPAGEPRIIEVRNLSPSEHPFHIHGMGFEVLSVNGEAPAYYTYEDTWNLAIRDIVRLRVDSANRGDWMTHCHILEHAEDGMMTVLRVE